MSTDSPIGQSGGDSRPLTSLERHVIRRILGDNCPDATVLRAQLEAASVSGHWKPSGSPSIDLSAPESAPRSGLADGVLPMDTYVYDQLDNYLGELIVWLANGRLASLEYAWVTDDLPQSLPPIEFLRVSRRQ